MLKHLRSLFGGKSPSPTEPREIFAAEVAQILGSRPDVKDVKRVPGAFAFDVMASGVQSRLFLDNAFAETREMSPEDRRERIEVFFAAVGAQVTTETWEEASATFVPVLRGATYSMEVWAHNPALGLVRRPFLPHIDVVVAMDRPTSISFVTRSAVEGWGVEEREVFERAASRAPLLANPSLELYDDTHGPLWIVTSNDSYESARLLVPGWLASLRGRIEGNPIAIIPERGTLMVGGDARPGMVERLLDKADREFTASSRRLSPAIYTVDAGGTVVPFGLPAGEALASKVKIAHEKLALYEHREQKDALERALEKRGLDVFVADYQVFEAREGELPRSRCVWTKGAHSYLPRTERVMLVVLDEKTGKLRTTVETSFDTILTRLTVVPDLHPARYETTGEYPSDEDLRSLAPGR
jgi:uncharacterized protein YtpQ (UPF0354 family)